MYSALSTYTLKQHLAYMSQYGTAIQITHFEVGSAGHDTGDPTQALTADPTWTATPGVYFGPKAITSVTTSGLSRIFTCDLDTTEGVGVLTSLGLIGTIVSVGASDPRGLTVGSTFLAAVVTFPYANKYSGETKTYEVYYT